MTVTGHIPCPTNTQLDRADTIPEQLQRGGGSSCRAVGSPDPSVQPPALETDPAGRLTQRPSALPTPQMCSLVADTAAASSAWEAADSLATVQGRGTQAHRHPQAEGTGAEGGSIPSGLECCLAGCGAPSV